MIVKAPLSASTISRVTGYEGAAIELAREPATGAGVDEPDQQQHEERRTPEHERHVELGQCPQLGAPRRGVGARRGQRGRGIAGAAAGVRRRPARLHRRCPAPAQSWKRQAVQHEQREGDAAPQQAVGQAPRRSAQAAACCAPQQSSSVWPPRSPIVRTGRAARSRHRDRASRSSARITMYSTTIAVAPM